MSIIENKLKFSERTENSKINVALRLLMAAAFSSRAVYFAFFAPPGAFKAISTDEV